MLLDFSQLFFRFLIYLLTCLMYCLVYLRVKIDQLGWIWLDWEIVPGRTRPWGFWIKSRTVWICIWVRDNASCGTTNRQLHLHLHLHLHESPPSTTTKEREGGLERWAFTDDSENDKERELLTPSSQQKTYEKSETETEKEQRANKTVTMAWKEGGRESESKQENDRIR